MPEETAVKKDRLAITIQGKFNQSRDVVFQTTVSLEATNKEIYEEFSRICDIMDRKEEFYLLKGLKITRDREEAELKRQIEKVADMEKHAAENWTKSNRRGPVEITGSVKTNIDNQKGAIENMREHIKKVDSDIKELETLQADYR
jgi:hypothetical protein